MFLDISNSCTTYHRVPAVWQLQKFCEIPSKSLLTLVVIDSPESRYFKTSRQPTGFTFFHIVYSKTYTSYFTFFCVCLKFRMLLPLTLTLATKMLTHVKKTCSKIVRYVNNHFCTFMTRVEFS